MKGEIVQKILKCLTESERGGFLARLALSPDGDILLKICKYLMANPTYTDTGLMNSCKLNRHQKNARLEELGRLLLTLHSIDDSLVTLSMLFVMAKRLMWDMLYNVSSVVVTQGIKVASQTEHFEWVVRFWDLVDDFPENIPGWVSIEGMSRIEARSHLNDLVQFGSLTDRIGQARREPTAENRKRRLEEIMVDAKRISSSANLSNKARWMYLKTMAFCHTLQSQQLDAIPYQEALVSLIEAHPETCIDPEHTRAKEIRSLAELYQRTGQGVLHLQTANRMKELPVGSLHSESQITNFRFPLAITMALDAGDTKTGTQACLELIEMLDNSSLSFSKQFQTENLYWVAYFYFAVGSQKPLSKVLKRLNDFGKTEFRPKFFLFSRVIRLTRAVEQSDWENAADEWKWLSNPKFVEELPSLPLALEFFKGLIDQKLACPKVEDSDKFPITLTELQVKLAGNYFLDFFDLSAWLEAKAQNCPMIEIFNHRAKEDS